MDRVALYRALRDAAGEHGLVGEHAEDLLDQVVESMAGDPSKDGDGEDPDEGAYFRTVLVVELLSPNAPFDGALTDLSGEIAAERVRAAVLAESTERIPHPYRCEAARPDMTVAEYLALDTDGRTEVRERVAKIAAVAARVPAGMLFTEAAAAIRADWPTATHAVFEVEPWDDNVTRLHAVQTRDKVLWTAERGSVRAAGGERDENREDWLMDGAHTIGELVRAGRDLAPDLLSALIRDHYVLVLADWLNQNDRITEPAADPVDMSATARLVPSDGSEPILDGQGGE